MTDRRYPRSGMTYWQRVRHDWRHPGREGLTMYAVIIGLAVITRFMR